MEKKQNSKLKGSYFFVQANYHLFESYISLSLAASKLHAKCQMSLTLVASDWSVGEFSF